MADRQPSRSEEEGQPETKDDPTASKAEKSQSSDSIDDLSEFQEAVDEDWSIVHSWSGDESSTEGRKKSCTHYAENDCEIAIKSKKCCSCMDKRPVTTSGLYAENVDGKICETATRWKYYCPNCQQYFNPETKAKFLRSRQSWTEKLTQSFSEEKRGGYFDLGRWLGSFRG
ncbi:hypothetical protein GGR54DRAFT_642826 [Hypoxylon sp. NC1633]|nr:hypothetical protein GGR54DRAFT_642826 [Hypoxylon sp. NC1633]